MTTSKMQQNVILKVTQARVEKIADRQNIDAQIKKLTAQRDAIDAEIKADMIAHGKIVCQYRNQTLVELQETRRHTIDSKRLRLEKPELAAAYTKESVSRHLHYVK